MATSVDAKLLKATKFPPEFNQKVDMQKVNVEVMKKWIAGKISEILGSEDDVVIELCFNLLEGARFPDIKVLQIQLTGFLDKDTAKFCKELWLLCLSAQSNPQGVPKELLEAKKLELIQEKIDAEKAAEEATRRKEQEKLRDRNIDSLRQRERGDRGRGRGRGGVRSGGDYDRRPPRYSRSPPPRRRDSPDRDSYLEAGVEEMIEEGAHDLLDALYLPHDHDRLLRQDGDDILRAEAPHPYAEEQVMEEVEGLLIVVDHGDHLPTLLMKKTKLGSALMIAKGEDIMMTGAATQVTAAAKNLPEGARAMILVTAEVHLGEEAKVLFDRGTAKGIGRLRDMLLRGEGEETHPLCLLLLTSDARWLTLLAMKGAEKHVTNNHLRLHL
ncbi:hypothetical protein MMC11_005986 [Xylographa trunciseda]|nr:hypothetical protein [Xylographa trunciseda]